MSRLASILWTSCLGAFAAGCSNRVELTLPTDGLVILASVSEAGDVGSAELIEGPVLKVERELEAGQLPLAFSIPDGQTYSADGYGGKIRAIVGAARSGCGRCLAANLSPPMLTFRASTCPIPEWAQSAYSGLLSPGSVDKARGQIRLEMDGECACLAPFSNDPPRAEVRLALGDFPYHHAALAPDGAVVLFGQGRALLVQPDGTREDVEIPVFGGPIRATTAMAESFVVASGSTEVELTLFDRSLQKIGSKPLTADPGSIYLSSAGSSLFVLGEELALSMPLVMICSGPAIDCATITSGANRQREVARDAVLTASGRLVVTYNIFGAEVYDRAPAVDEVVRAEPDRVVVRAGEIVRRRIPMQDFTAVRVGALGERVFVCGGGRSSSVEVRTFDASDPLGVVTNLGHFSAGPCSGVRRSGDGTIDIGLGSRILRLDADGREVAQLTPDEVIRGAGSELEIARQVGLDRYLAFGGGRSVFVATATSARLVIGDESWRAGARLVSHLGEPWLIASAHTQRIGGPEAPGLDFPVAAAVSDGVDVAVVGADEWATFDTGTSQVSSRAPLQSGLGIASRILAFGPGDFLIVDLHEGLRMRRLVGGRVRDLPIDWDFASTPELELPLDVALFHADTRDGVAFIVGMASTNFAFRVLPSTDGGARVERVALPVNADMDGIIARCPDDALAWSIGDQLTDLVEIRERSGALEGAVTGQIVSGKGGGSGSFPLWTDEFLVRAKPSQGGVELLGVPRGPVITLDGTVRGSASAGGALYLLTHNGAVWAISLRPRR